MEAAVKLQEPEAQGEVAPFELHGRRRGEVPRDLGGRLRRAGAAASERLVALSIAKRLGGIAPGAVSSEERRGLDDEWGNLCEVGSILRRLEEVGYGALSQPRSRAQRRHGLHRTERLRGVVGHAPRSWPLQLPTSADTHCSGRNDGEGVYGEVECSITLRSAHLGMIFALGGLWHKFGVEDHVDTTAGELVQLLTGRRCAGGRDVVQVHELLAELESLKIKAEVRERPGKEPDEGLRISEAPLARVQRRVRDRWVDREEYAAASIASEEDPAELVEARQLDRGECTGTATIRVTLSPELLHDLRHRTPTLINFEVWASLRPSAQRNYALLQAWPRDPYDGRRRIFLAAPLRYLLGFKGQRLDRAKAAVEHDLCAIVEADRRYREGFGCSTWATTNLPAFSVQTDGAASQPTAAAKKGKSLPKRARLLRRAERLRQQLAPNGAARRETEAIREVIERSLGEAVGSSPGAGSGLKQLRFRRRQGKADADADHPAAS